MNNILTLLHPARLCLMVTLLALELLTPGLADAAHRSPAASNQLKSLAASTGTLSPAFRGDHLDYTLTVSSLVTSVQLSAAPLEARTALEISVNGGPWRALVANRKTPALAFASGSLRVQVRASSAQAPARLYTITILRAQPTAVVSPIQSPLMRVNPRDGTSSSPALMSGTLVSASSVSPTPTNAVQTTLSRPPAPVVTSISPTSGSAAGGTSVTITGTNFTGATGATVGGVDLTSFKVVNDTTITGTTGAHAAGLVDVAITGSLGGASTGGTGIYNVVPPLIYDFVLNGPNESPSNTSPAVGTARVTIDPSVDTMRVQCSFSGLNGSSTAAHLHGATTAPGTGTAGVMTTTPSFVGFPTGVTSGSMDQTYDLTLATSYNPSFVNAQGGTAASAKTALMNSLASGTTYFNIHSNAFSGGEIRGFAKETTTNADLANLVFSTGTLSPAFVPGTTAYSFSVPDATSSLSITATKSGASATLQVQVNGGGYTALTSGSPSGSLALNVGTNTVDVKVTAQDGTTIKTYTTTITRAVAAPVVTSIAPSTGPTAGTTSVTITGTGFTGATGATVGGVALTSFNVVSDTTITGTTGAHAAGTVDVAITGSPGGASTGGTGLFTYVVPAPTVTANTGNLTTLSTSLTITGTGFDSVTPGHNTVIFTPAGSGTVTAATATSLTVTGLSGLTLGALNAVVVTNSQKSGTPVQVATVVAPGPGELDPLNLNVVGAEGSANVAATAIQPDGKMIIAGTFIQVLGVARNNIARLNADGTLDTGFDPKADDTVQAVAVQADGKVLLGGRFTSLQPNGAASATTRNRIARLNADGTLDTGFDPNANNTVQAVAVQADGKVLLGGIFTSLQPTGAASATTRNRIARLNTDGTLDTGFDPKANDLVYSVAVQADGKVLLGGDFTSLQPNGAASATTRGHIARVNADGTLDTGFDPNANNAVASVAVQADGKVLLGGIFTSLQPNGAASDTPRNFIARVNTDGTLDTSFDPKASSLVFCMAVQADGKVLLGGDFTSLQPNGAASAMTRNRIARVNADGTLDMTFDPCADSFVFSVAVQADGKVLLGGASPPCSPMARPRPRPATPSPGWSMTRPHRR